MKLKKSQIKELIRQAIVEDIMDKEIKNSKTGNMIKLRTALQLPDEHPANKKAKDMVAKAGIDKDDVGGPSYPNVKKGVKTSKQAKGKDKPAFVKPSTTGQGYSYDEPSHADDVEDNWDKASKGFDSMADKYGVRIDDQSDWSGYENNPQGEYSVSGKNSEDPGDGFSVYSTVETGEDGESYDGNKNIIAFPQDDDPFGGQVEVEFDSIGDAQKALDDILSDKRIKKVLDGGRGSMAKAKDYIKKELESWEANPKISGAGAADDANAKMDAAEKAAKEKKKGKIKSNPFSKKEVKESKGRRFTVKEVRMWMKKLEENRYKKVYNSDARRVAWMVNNEGVEISEMPKSMSKKWTKAQYGRERYLATEFIKSKSEQMNEGKLTEGFKKIAKKNVKYKDKTGTYNWQIESGIDTDVMGGNTPKIILSYQHEDEKGFPTSGGNFFWLKEKDGTPYTPQKAKALVNKISNKKIGDFHRKSTKPSGSGNLIVMKGNKFIREGKLTSEQKLRKSIREIIKEQLNEKTFGSQAQYMAYRKKHNLKPGSKHKVAGKTVTVRDVKKISKSAAKKADKFAAAQNAKLDAAEKAMKKKNEGKLTEDYKNSEWEVYVKDEKGKEKIVKKAKSKRAATILYNKIIKSDDYYEVGMKVVKEGNLTEVKFKKVILPNDMKTKVKVSKMIKQLKLKIDKDYDVKALKARGGDQVISILPKHYNKFIELAMQNKLNPRG